MALQVSQNLLAVYQNQSLPPMKKISPENAGLKPDEPVPDKNGNFEFKTSKKPDSEAVSKEEAEELVLVG